MLQNLINIYLTKETGRDGNKQIISTLDSALPYFKRANLQFKIHVIKPENYDSLKNSGISQLPALISNNAREFGVGAVCYKISDIVKKVREYPTQQVEQQNPLEAFMLNEINSNDDEKDENEVSMNNIQSKLQAEELERKQRLEAMKNGDFSNPQSANTSVAQPSFGDGKFDANNLDLLEYIAQHENVPMT